MKKFATRDHVCTIDRERQHRGRATTFRLGGYVISFSQAAGFYPLIFPKGFLLILERIDSLERKKNIFSLITFIFIFCIYLSNPIHVCSFYIYICTFYFKTIISALIRQTITIQSQLVSQFTRLNLETPAAEPRNL